LREITALQAAAAAERGRSALIAHGRRTSQMHIDDDHWHYGSALIQIAEDSHFTAINAFKINGRASRCGFRVNKDIGVYIRYRTEPQGQRWSVYTFSFSQDNLAELRRMSKRLSRVFLALVCVKDREICCLPYNTFLEFVQARRIDKGAPEPEYLIDVNVPRGMRLRVWNSPSGTKGHWLCERLIPRSDFPSAMFAPSPAGIV
jgi:hypothetical protein